MNSIDVEPNFADFNVFETLDPRYKQYPDQERLLELVHQARSGRKESLRVFADVMHDTLRRETFEDFMHSRGRELAESSYEEWFYEKIFQFVRILLYEALNVLVQKNGGWVMKSIDFPSAKEHGIISIDGEVVQPDEIERAIPPEHNAQRPWYDLAWTVTNNRPQDRLNAARKWFDRFRKRNWLTLASEGGWEKNRERDRIILQGLAHDHHRREICRELDRFGGELLKALHNKGFKTWTEAWDDPEGRPAIYSLFSKVPVRRRDNLSSVF